MEKKQVFVMLGVIIAITAGIVMYILFFGNQYTVTFDSNGGSEVDKQTIKTGGTVEEPEEPERDGYKFIEWQHKGTSFDFKTKIRRNMTLIAKWEKLSDILYTVKFDSNGGSAVSEQEIREGEKVTKPTNPTRSGYTFEGWYSNGAQYDFNKTLTSDLELKAEWKANSTGGNNSDGSSVSGELKVGDRVEIIGSYASSSTSKEALHSRAKGWTRVILKIYDGREFPYRVGNSTGTTGFFKEESLRKIS